MRQVVPDRTTIEQRASEQCARAVFEHLYPDDTIRRAVLRLLDTAMRAADDISPHAGQLTLCPDNQDEIRLNVGCPWNTVLRRGTVFVVVDRSQLEACGRRTLHGCTVLPGARIDARWGADGVTIPGQELHRVYPSLEVAHLHFVRDVAERQPRSPHARYHSPGIVAYMRGYLHPASTDR
jgi:hypothetical protein